MNIYTLYLTALSGLLTVGYANAQASPNTDQTTDNTMVITATKQSPYSASSMNVSSTSIDASQLKDAKVMTVNDLVRVLPGLNIESSGSLLFPIISLRGVSSADNYYNPSVAVYVDGVPLLSSDILQSLDDVQSVQILKGPQGTLYGKSAQGGIINIITKQPDSNKRASVSAGYASRESDHEKVSVSGPLKDGLLYGSFSLVRNKNQGDFTNPSTGSDDLGGYKSELGHLKLRLAPEGQPWESTLDISSDCTAASQDTYVDFNDLTNKTLSLNSGSPDPYLKRCTHSQSLASQYTTDNWHIHFTTAFQQQHYSRVFPNGSLLATMPEKWRQNVQELRMSTYGKGRTVDAVVGLYHQYTKENLALSYDMLTGSNYQTTNSTTTMENLSAYTDLTWHVTDKLNLGSGARISHDRAKTNYMLNQLGTEMSDNASLSDNQIMGQLSAGYQLTQAWYVYSRVAQGYKPAGYNIQPPASSRAFDYKAEKSMNYEIGSRYEAGDIHFKGAIFFTHTRDMQIYSGAQGFQTLDNAGQTNAKGIELSTNWNFMPGWSWNVNASAVDSKFTSRSTLYSGNKVPFVPTFSAGSSVRGFIDTDSGTFTPRLAIRVVGPQYFDGNNTLKQSTYAITDFNLGWQATHALHLSLYTNNMFNRRYRTYGYTSGASQFAQVNMGRTVGLDARYDFF